MGMYMLKRGHSANAYDGVRREKRGPITVTIKQAVMMEPGKAVETDLDMQHWVDAGVIVELKQDAVVPAPVSVQNPTPEPEPEPENVESASEAPEEDIPPSYEELEDGSFRCLICARGGEEKILKSEAAILKHIAKH